MATIREIAEYTNMSPSTVSIVLNGKSEARNISEKTARKILQAARELGYTPNISARRLRNNNTKKYVAVFWANDYRAPLLFQFINGMHKYLEASNNNEIEIVLRLFTPDSLSKSANPELLTMYSATIICTASKMDLDYLQKTNFSTPIVLYNRFSNKYSNVLVVNEDIGSKAAEIFISHGKKKAAIFVAQSGQFLYCEKRMSGFMNTFSNSGGITTVVSAPQNSLCSANKTIEETESVFKNADCVFCLQDILAFSYMNYIRNTGIAEIPSRQEVICIGTHDQDAYENQYIPLSVIEIPIEEMGRECLRIVTEIMDGDFSKTESKVMEFTYTPRSTCP